MYNFILLHTTAYKRSSITHLNRFSARHNRVQQVGVFWRLFLKLSPATDMQQSNKIMWLKKQKQFMRRIV